MSQLSSQRANVPLEILREIVEVAFLFNYTTGPVLALTCKSINRWITPLLYSSVSLNKENILPFIRGVESAQRGTLDHDIGAYVKKLHFQWDAMKHCDWTLSLCKSVTQLLVYTYGHDYDIDERFTDTSLWPKPWHVMVLSFFPSWILPRRELFAHTTHLYIEESLLPPILSLCATMPLTHICFIVPDISFSTPDDDDDDDDDYEETILAHLNQVQLFLGLPVMQCVLIHAYSEAPFVDLSDRIWRSLADITDERFIVAPGMARDELTEAFEEGRTVWDNIADWKTWRQMARLQIL